MRVRPASCGLAAASDYYPIDERLPRIRNLPYSQLTPAPSLSTRLEDVQIQDFSHSFASRALALGEELPIIDQLLGHRRIETTAREYRPTPN